MTASLIGQASKCTSRGGGDVDALEPAAVPGPSPLALCTDSQEGDKLEMEGKLGRGGAQWAWVQVPESG